MCTLQQPINVQALVMRWQRVQGADCDKALAKYGLNSESLGAAVEAFSSSASVQTVAMEIQRRQQKEISALGVPLM